MLAAIAALALPMPAYASGVIDNVNGIAIGPDGKIVHFGALMIDDEGKVEKLIQGRYQEPEYKPKKPKRGQPWPERPKGPSFKLDAGGKTLIPGLIDAHGHVMGLGLSLITLDLSDTKSLAEAQAKIRAYAQENTGRKWIIGTGWNQETWGLGRFPTAAELDAAVGDIPVWLERIDGHAGWANSAAIRAAGVSAATKAPTGGRIEMAAGKPAGVFVDKAMDLIQKVVPAPAPKDRDNALEKAQRALLAVGITGIADMGTSIEDWQAFRRSADRGALRVRIMSYAYGLDNMVLIAGPEPTPWLYDDHLRMGGIKLLLDGALGSRGAWLKADYSDAPGQRGLPMIPSTQLRNIMSRAAMDNFQVAVHAIGDAANGEILDAIQEMSDTYTGDRRWRVEHAQIIDPADLPRFARYGTIASMQPVHETSDWRMATARLGEARLKGAYSWKAMLDNKVPLAFGSDVPVESPNPFPGIAAAMSRQDAKGEPAGGWMPEQRISFEAALDGFTRQAAFAGFAEKKFGSLVPGQWADFLLIDRDIETASPTDIRGTQVLETWINGKRVYVKGQ
ncbi:amidohydrolase [Sphingobium yanoikuyae]|uniref:Amidohydrolase n=1 Tax=Sphingobium yanoikuyae TaxID=13690 RepID=A0AA43BCL1_SPHYA|nr:amidohydrolase [Sphingobium yanoikuyae]MDH2132599.1 amidohydrolase [Sphingobium yanoikuyae]MDH2151740.1 amidohydrolase [Sphingobium yanoikuyae]MDH2167988.1 amidohydrolase [Sphingobium yanoikuyae]